MARSNIKEQITKEMLTLTEVAKALTMHLDLPTILNTVMERIDDMLDPAEFGIVLLWDPSRGLIRPRAFCGNGINDSQALLKIELDDDESITGQVFCEGKLSLLRTTEEVVAMQKSLKPDNRALMLQALGSVQPKSIIAAPLITSDRTYGVLIFGSLTNGILFSEREVPIVQIFADLIALAIDRSRLEEEALANESFKQVDRIRAEAFATLSHELRTPLAAIKGYSTALLLEDISWSENKRKEFLNFIDEECDNLQIMINDILDSALIDVEQMVLEKQPVKLDRLAYVIAEEIQHRSKIHQLVVDFPADFPILDADELRIKQVIRNIIDNSIKYSPDGGLIVIRGEVRDVDVVISISDQGVGISPEDLIPLFEKYFRVKSATGYYIPGTGLGLPIARTIIENHGGRIWAESKVGEGTTLYFSLPRDGYSSSDPIDEANLGE